MKWAVNENTIFQCDLPDYLSACKKAGFKAVEISYIKLKDALRFVTTTELRKQCKGLEILTLNAFEDIFLVPKENLKVLETETVLLGELCRQVECPAVVAPSGRWNNKYGELPEYKELIKLYRDRMGIVKNILDSYGIETMFEPISYPEFIVGTPEEVNDVLYGEELYSVRIVPDIHNLYYNTLCAAQLFDMNAEIGMVHIDDTPNIPREQLHVAKTRCFPGEGIADVAEWLKQAEKKGYKGFYSLELFDDGIYSMNTDEAAVLCMKKLEAFAESL